MCLVLSVFPSFSFAVCTPIRYFLWQRVVAYAFYCRSAAVSWAMTILAGTCNEHALSCDAWLLFDVWRGGHRSTVYWRNRPRTHPPGSHEIAKRHAGPLRVRARAGARRTPVGVRRARAGTRAGTTPSPSVSRRAFPSLTLRCAREAGATARRAHGSEVYPEHNRSEGGDSRIN